MREPFYGIRLKLKRAWQEIKTIEAEIGTFVKSDVYEPVIEFNPDANIVTASAHIKRYPDPMWSVRIGEVIHNLRSALDHAIWEIYFIDNLHSPVTKQNQFPIFENEAGFISRGVSKFLDGIGPSHIPLIKSFQPFPESDGGTGEGVKSPLWHLKELSDADKHRTIYLTGTILETFRFTFPPLAQAVSIKRQIRMEPGPINENTVLARAFLTGSTGWPFADKKVKCEFNSDVAFDHGTPAVGGWIVSATLVDVANRTESILRRIAEDIFKSEL